MKKIFASLVFFVSVSAFACPDLDGSYKNADGDIQDIHMGTLSGITTFQWGDKAPAMLVDGKDHDFDLDLSYNLTCDAQSLTLLLKGDRGIIKTVIVKTAQGYKYTSDDPQNPGDEYTKLP
jgi:hypothetical protein